MKILLITLIIMISLNPFCRASDEVWRTEVGGTIYDLVYSPNGNYIAVCNSEGKVLLLNSADGSTAKEFAGQEGNINSLAFSKNGELLAGGAAQIPEGDGKVRLWNIATGENIKTFSDMIPLNNQNTLKLSGVAFANDDKYLIAASTLTQDNIFIWDLTADEVIKKISTAGRLLDLAVSPGAEYFAVNVNFPNQVEIYNLSDFSSEGTICNDIWVHGGLDFSDNGKLLAVGTIDGDVQAWDYIEKTQFSNLKIFDANAMANSLCFSPNSSYLAGAGVQFSEDGNDTYAIRVWHVNSGTLIHTFENYVPFSIAPSPTANYLAIEDRGSVILLNAPWDINSAEESEAESAINIKFFPNPAVNLASVEFYLPHTCSVEFSVFNEMGIEVYKESRHGLYSGINEVKINTASLASGIYYCIIQSGTYLGGCRFAVLH